MRLFHSTQSDEETEPPALPNLSPVRNQIDDQHSDDQLQNPNDQQRNVQGKFCYFRYCLAIGIIF
jgi:hypothetical protein